MDGKRPGERRNSALGLDKALNKTKEGSLYKRQGALLQDDWKLYRFVLKEDHISYFKNKQVCLLSRIYCSFIFHFRLLFCFCCFICTNKGIAAKRNY